VRHEGNRLDDDEVLGMVFLLLVAGHDTTANLLAMSALMLTEHPDQLERLRNDPGLIQPYRNCRSARSHSVQGR